MDLPRHNPETTSVKPAGRRAERPAITVLCVLEDPVSTAAYDVILGAARVVGGVGIGVPGALVGCFLRIGSVQDVDVLWPGILANIIRCILAGVGVRLTAPARVESGQVVAYLNASDLCFTQAFSRLAGCTWRTPRAGATTAHNKGHGEQRSHVDCRNGAYVWHCTAVRRMKATKEVRVG